MTNKEFLIEKIISLSLIGVLMYSLSLQAIVTLFIITGQAHFLIAYYYKYRHGISKKTLVWYPIALIPLLFLGFTGQLVILAVLSTVVFAIHFGQDEIFLAGKETSLFTSLEVLAFVLVISGIVVDLILNSSYLIYFFTAASLVLAVYAFLIVTKKYIFTRVSIYLLLATFGLSLITLLGYQIPLEKLIGGIILLHFSTWYINYFFKTKNNPPYRKQYIKMVILMNAISLGFFLILVNFNLAILYYFFALIYFYVWTIMHIIVSIRPSDYTNGIRIS